MEKINGCIQCSVDTCAYHDQWEEYCTLRTIQVGCTAAKPKSCDCTECASFKAKGGSDR